MTKTIEFSISLAALGLKITKLHACNSSRAFQWYNEHAPIFLLFYY
jgi:hypothetical protein